jgi:hypothetical protein
MDKAMTAMKSLGSHDKDMEDWALIMQDLSTSTRIFRSPDRVTPATNLRIKHKLFASPVMDMMQWWRDEFETAEHAIRASFFFLDESGSSYALPAIV